MTNLHGLTRKIKGGLIEGLNSNEIVGLQNGVPRIEGLRLGSAVDANGKTRVLTEGGGERNSEEGAVKISGEGEKGKNLEERGEGEWGNGATVLFGHDAFDGAVVSDSGVTQLHGLHRKPGADALFGDLVGG